MRFSEYRQQTCTLCKTDVVYFWAVRERFVVIVVVVVVSVIVQVVFERRNAFVYGVNNNALREGFIGFVCACVCVCLRVAAALRVDFFGVCCWRVHLYA